MAKSHRGNERSFMERVREDVRGWFRNDEHESIREEWRPIRNQGWSRKEEPRWRPAKEPQEEFKSDYYREYFGSNNRGGNERYENPGLGRSYGRFQGLGSKSFKREDNRVREDVCRLMEDHGELDATDIDVTVNGGEVTLKGTVADRKQRRLAEEIVESVWGVKEVHNTIRVEALGWKRTGPPSRRLETTASKKPKAA